MTTAIILIERFSDSMDRCAELAEELKGITGIDWRTEDSGEIRSQRLFPVQLGNIFLKLSGNPETVWVEYTVVFSA